METTVNTTGDTIKKAAIAMDKWKLSIFQKHLIEAGYTFSAPAKLTRTSLVITVLTTDLAALGDIVRAANIECAHVKEDTV